MKKFILIVLLLLTIAFFYEKTSLEELKVVEDKNQNALKAYLTVYEEDGGRSLYLKLKIRSRYIRQLKAQQQKVLGDESRNFVIKELEVDINNYKKEAVSVFFDKNCERDYKLINGAVTRTPKGWKSDLNISGLLPITDNWDYDEKSYCFYLTSDNSIFSLDEIKSVDFNIENHSKNEEKISIQQSFVDLSKFKHFNKISQTKAEFLKENPIFEALEENKITLSGTHDINETIVIPNTVELTIQANTTLNMAVGVSFVSYGKVNAIGTPTQPITVQAQNPEKPFGTFALANEGAAGSHFKNFHIEHGSETTINGIYFSGMFSAYHNDDILVEDSYFGYSHSDDGLNFKYSNSKVINSIFEKNSADAIDFDFMAGEVRGNTFLENGNDSVDTSGSTTFIHDNYIYKSGDKCMSFGENSKTIVINNILDGCFIGVECKDLTTSVMINNAIINNKTAFNSYQKKDFFGPAHCEFHNTVFAGNDRGITFENNFSKDGKKLKTDTSKVTIKNSILPDKEYKKDNIIEKLPKQTLSDNRPANLAKLKEFLPEFIEDNIGIGIIDREKIPRLK